MAWPKYVNPVILFRHLTCHARDCVYTGIFDTVLSWQFFVPLARLSYSGYLIHPILCYLFFYASPVQIYYNNYLFVSLFFYIFNKLEANPIYRKTGITVATIIIRPSYIYQSQTRIKHIVVSTAGEPVPGEHHRYHDPLRHRQRRLRGASADG